MSRISGCPFTVRDYSIEIKNQVTGQYTRIKGLNSMSVNTDAQTDDGSAADALWAERFIKGRNVSGSIEARPIADRVTGARDAGQAMMHRAAFSGGGCENDQTLRIADAVGRAVEYDCVVTKESRGADEDGETVTWDWEGVGAPRELAYVQTASVGFAQNGTAVTAVSAAAGADIGVDVVFTPSDASNRRYSYYMADETVARVAAIDGNHIGIRFVAPGSTVLTVKTMNNARIAELTVAVTAAE